MEVKITTLIENNQDYDKKLLYEHGLSLYIETDNKKILFDTGQTGDFIKNAQTLNKSLDDLDYLILSHGHYDHSGGVLKLLDKLNNNTKIILSSEFFDPKYKTLENNEYKFNGNSFDESMLKDKGFSIQKITEDITYITDKIMIFHNFKRFTDYEKRNKKFFIRTESGYIPDDFKDEICLGVITKKGLIVIAGCSHIGIINILRTITEKTNKQIYTVIGGTHMVDADKERIDKTITDLKSLDIKHIAVSHCTGTVAAEILKNTFKDNFIVNNTGNIIEI